MWPTLHELEIPAAVRKSKKKTSASMPVCSVVMGLPQVKFMLGKLNYVQDEC